MPCWKNQPWPRDSNETASGKPGAVQVCLLGICRLSSAKGVASGVSRKMHYDRATKDENR